MSNERGVWTFGPIVGLVIVALALVGLFAICNDNGEVDALGRLELVSHEYGGGYYEDEDNWGGEDRNRNRGRDRGAFSPGPFRDSPVDAFNNVCMPGATCHYDDRQRNEPPPDERETP